MQTARWVWKNAGPLLFSKGWFRYKKTNHFQFHLRSYSKRLYSKQLPVFLPLSDAWSVHCYWALSGILVIHLSLTLFGSLLQPQKGQTLGLVPWIQCDQYNCIIYEKSRAPLMLAPSLFPLLFHSIFTWISLKMNQCQIDKMRRQEKIEKRLRAVMYPTASDIKINKSIIQQKQPSM